MLLDKYATCTSSAEVVKVQNDYIQQCEKEQGEKKDQLPDEDEGNLMIRRVNYN